MATVQQIYIAIFGRPADPVGLAYWNEQTNNGEDLSAMIAAFTAAPEYQERFEGQSNEEIISSIYQSLFGREPDAEGLEFYADALASGELPIETIAVRILDGAQNDDQTTIENKTEAAEKFTASLDTQEEIDGYVGEDAANEAADFLSTVDEDPESVPSDNEIDEVVEQVNTGTYPDPEPETPDEGAAPGGGGSGGDDDDDDVDPGPTLEQRAAEIHADWIELDTNYTDYYIDDVNEAFIRLGVRYAEYLEDGGEVLTDVRVKNDDPEVRDQSLHDNLLGNLNQVSLEDRNLPTDKEAELIDLIEGVNAGLLQRPTEDGNPPTDFSAADAWDLLNEIERPDLAVTPVDMTDTSPVVDRAMPISSYWETDLGSVVITTNPDGEVAPAFDRYQGLQADADGEPYDIQEGAMLSFDFNIDTLWAGDGDGQVAGLWVQMQNEEGTLPYGGNFSIAEYVDADAAVDLGLGDSAGFRFWNEDDGWSEIVEYGGPEAANLTFAFTDTAHVWFLNGEEVYTDTGADVGLADVIDGLIFNAQNFGDVAENYTFSDVSIAGVAPVIEDSVA